MTGRAAMILTGASSGVGRALALRAAAEGYAVFAVARRAPLLDELVFATGGFPGEIAPFAADIGVAGAPKRIVAAALERFGRIDVLVNNAGYVTAGSISQQTDAELRKQFEVHVLAPLALLREALPALRATRGHAIFVGSGVARVPVGGLGAYPSAKAALRSATRIARNELRADGITVTYVDPGAVDTEFMRRAGLAGAPKALLASPEDVARKILASVSSGRAVVNAVPWQAPFLAVGEALPGLADFVLARAPGIVGGAPPGDEPVAAPPEAAPHEPVAEPEPPRTPLDAALAPVEHRMARLKLQRAFVEGLLRPGAVLETGEVALRWAGMPNKNERALVHEVLEALADGGLLERLGPERYSVR